MEQGKTTYVFEDDETRALHSAWHRGDDAPALTFDELVGLVFPGLPGPAARAEAFARLLSPAQLPRAEALLYTVDKLREAQILSPDEVDFAFAELPDTPKNRELRDLLVRYAGSALACDRTFHVRQLVEKLEAREVAFAGGKRVLFVRGRGPSSALFTDVAAAFGGAEGVEETRLVDFSELGADDGRRRGLTLYGDVAPSLRAAGDAVARLVARKVDPADIVVPFAGDRKALHWLRHFFHHHSIPYRVHVAHGEPAASAETATTLPKLLGALRRETSRALRDRLRLSQLLIEAGASRRSRETWDACFEKLVARGKIEPADTVYLTGLLLPASDEAAPAGEPAARRDGVLIAPFLPFPQPPGTASVAYVDATVLQPPRTPLLFREGEIELLHGRGFALPRLTAYRERLMELFASYTGRAGERRILFSTLPVGSFPQAGRSGRVERRARRRLTRADSIPFDMPAAAGDERFSGQWETSALAAPLTRPLSATQLETYAKCPALYFFSQRLKLRPSETGEDKYPLVFGQAAHLALESYFRELAKRSERPAPAAMVEELGRAFQTAVRQVSPGLDDKHPLFVILRENFARLARHVPVLEEKLGSIAGKLTPFSFEEEFRIDLGDVSIRGKIDRIDRRDDGAVLVLDYKTGTVDFTPGHVHQGTHFQALLYLVAAEKLFRVPCVGIVFYDLKKGEARRGIFIDELVAKEAKKGVTRGHVLPQSSYEELRDQGMARLREIASRITAGSFLPVASPEACLVCDYASLCRKRVGYA